MLTWTGPQTAVDPTADLVLYECGICACYHPWEFAGDCRDDANRFGSPEEYAEKRGVDSLDIEVRSMDERVQADLEAK